MLEEYHGKIHLLVTSLCAYINYTVFCWLLVIGQPHCALCSHSTILCVPYVFINGFS